MLVACCAEQPARRLARHTADGRVPEGGVLAGMGFGRRELSGASKSEDAVSQPCADLKPIVVQAPADYAGVLAPTSCTPARLPFANCPCEEIAPTLRTHRL